MRYVSLHTHTTFSYGDGYGTVAQHVSRVADLGMSALALTEHGNVSSWVQLEIACKRAGIKPIYGCEIYTGPREVKEKIGRKTHMTLLAANSVGLQNLNYLVMESWKTLGPDAKWPSKSKFPTVHWEKLKENADGIIALSGCADSFLSCVLLGGKSYGPKRLELREGDLKRAIDYARLYKEVFGERYFLEVQRFPRLERTCVLNPAFAEISEIAGIPLAATSDVHYPYPNQNEMQRILHAAHRGQTVESADASWEYGVLLTYPESDREIFKDLVATGLSKEKAKGAVLNTERISALCNVELPKVPVAKYVVGEGDWEPW